MKIKVIIILSLFLCQLPGSAMAAMKSPDAVAIRVIPNPQHYSAARWYERQGFTGSPQSIEVDGYESVRDGRSVYVNASNISGNTLYTNIYVISFNQNAELATEDIFSELLSHWTFNFNIRDTGECSINSNRCSKTADCQKGETCSAGLCKLETMEKCVVDDDCLPGTFCTAKKAKTVRDTRRLSDISEIKLALDNYFRNKKVYPKLDSGTYLMGRTLSVWPSWREKFAQDIGGYALDPVNKIGVCPGAYNQSTCWNESLKTFSGAVPSSATSNTLPVGSLLYSYFSVNKGEDFVLCATMESGYLPSLYCLRK